MKIAYAYCWRCSYGFFIHGDHIINTPQKVLSLEKTQYGYLIRLECLNCGMHNTFLTQEKPEIMEVQDETDN
jgi:hypothetical protein